MRRTTGAIVAAVSVTLVATTSTAASPHPKIAASSVTAVTTGLPAGTSAALVNLTMVDGRNPGYITADRCSALAPGTQTKSTGNHGVRAATAALAVVPVDTDGRFCIANQNPVELVVDVQARFAPAAPDGLRFVPAAPTRVLDTRTTSRPAGGSITTVASGAPIGATAALVNIAMVAGLASGFVTADRCSALAPGPQTHSNGNHGLGTPVSNLSVVPLDPDGTFCVYNLSAVHIVIDVQGSFTPDPASGLGFIAAGPVRVADTRLSPTGRPAPGSITRIETGLPPGTATALVNIAMTESSEEGYVTADRCSALAAGPQTRSSGNHPVLAAASNLAVVALDADGSFCIFNQVAIHLAVDLQGAFSATAPDELFTVAPTRLLDTRPPTPAVPTTSCTSVVHIGDSASVGMISPSYLADPADRIDAQYRRVGVTDPRMQISGARSIVETLPGQINARDVAAGIKATGYEGCWVLALGTTDTANIAAGSGPGRRSRIDMMMAVIGDDPVMWVNVRTAVAPGDPWSNANMQLWNTALATAAPSYPNLRIYDWNALMNPAWFGGDRIHYSVDGYRQRARLIADALAATFPG